MNSTQKVLGVLLAMVLSIFVQTGSAFAATFTWDGGGVDDNFSTAANWVGDVAPTGVATDDLVFSPQSEDFDVAAPNNDLVGATFNSITVAAADADNADNPVISGNAFALLSDSGGLSSGDGLLYIDADVSIGADLTLTRTTLRGDVAIGANSLTIGVAAYIGDNINNIGSQPLLTGSGVLIQDQFQSETGGIGGCDPLEQYAQTYQADFSGFTGSVLVTEFDVVSVIAIPSDLSANASVTVADGGTLSMYGQHGVSDTFATNLTLNGGVLLFNQWTNNSCGHDSEDVTLTLTGDVTATAEVDTYIFNLSAVNLTGTVTGAEFLTLNNVSEGSLVIGGESQEPEPFTTTYDSDTANFVIVSRNETAIVTATVGDTSVQDGGILKGTGTVGRLNVFSGGTLAPGLSPGCMNSGDLTLASGSVYQVEINGTARCTEYDHMNVTGTVDVTGATLEVIMGNAEEIATGTVLMIIGNDGVDAVVGTFDGLANGATVTIGEASFRINYDGGDGNDVTLTALTVPAAPDTGIEMLIANPVVPAAATAATALGLLGLKRRFSN